MTSNNEAPLSSQEKSKLTWQHRFVKAGARELFLKHNGQYPDPEVYIHDKLLKRFEKDLAHLVPFLEKYIVQGGIRWVKCADQLPEITWQGIVKWTDQADYAIMSEFGFCNGNIYDYGNVYESQPIEWLSEPAQGMTAPAK